MKIAILDKDGTIIEPISGEKFVQHPKDQQFIYGASLAIAQMKNQGYTLAIASNQGGVASGKKSFESALEEMIFAMELTGIEYAMFAHSYENEGYGEAVWIDRSNSGQQWKIITNSKTKFRKPNPGMIDYIATRLFGNRLWHGEVEVLMVGDREEDRDAAKAAGVDFMWAVDWIG